MQTPSARKTLLSVILVYMLCLGIRLYWINHKEGLDVDEGLSIALSNYNRFMLWSDNYENNRQYSGAELKAISLWNDASLLDVIRDIYRLRVSNPDTPHTNLYYSCLRLWFAGRTTTDYLEIIRWGTRLNLVFFTISFLSVYGLLRLLFDDSLLVAAVLCICFLSTGSISNTLLLRPYALQEAALSLVTLAVVWYQDRAANSWPVMVLLCGTLSLALLSGYLSILYVLPLCVLLVLPAPVKRVGFVTAAFVCAIVLAQIVYPNYLQGMISSSRGQEALTLVSTNSLIPTFLSAVSLSFRLIERHMFYWPMIILLGIAAVAGLRGKVFAKVGIRLAITAALFSIAAMYVAPYKILRYIMPVFPVLGLTTGFILGRLKPKHFAVVALGCVLTSVVFAFDGSRVENLFPQKAALFRFTLQPEVPVLVLNTSYWKYADMIPYVNDKQTYEFLRTREELSERMEKLPRAFVVVEQESFPREFDARYSFLSSMGYFDLYGRGIESLDRKR